MAAMTFDAVFTPALIAKVQKCIDEADKTGARVSAWDTIQSILLEHKVAWRSQVQPEFVGIHPQNRSRLGVGGSEAHFHGQQVLTAGFSWRKAGDATAIEAPPPPFNEEALSVNSQLVSLSGGLIPPLQALRLLSVGGGHTNTFLRAVQAECPTPVRALAGDGGKLQRDILCAGRPAFKEAVDAGLHWCIMHWQTPYIWPQLVHLVQAALNTHAKGDTSEIECLLDMSRMRDASLAAGKEPDWTEIQAAAKFSMPPCSPYMGSLANYVRIQAPELITELSMFQKAFACNEQGVSRVPGGEFFNKLCSLQWGVAGKCPCLLLAAAEANLASPANRISDGICRLVTPGALAALTSADNRATATGAGRSHWSEAAPTAAAGCAAASRAARRCCGLGILQLGAGAAVLM